MSRKYIQADNSISAPRRTDISTITLPVLIRLPNSVLIVDNLVNVYTKNGGILFRQYYQHLYRKILTISRSET